MKFNGSRMEEELVKAYRAGTIAGIGKIVVFGICADRGTYGQFAEVRMDGISFQTSVEALTEFTDYINEYHHNKGKSDRKTHFRLTHRHDELAPLFECLGLKTVFSHAWERVKQHDVEEGLVGIWPACGVLENWQERTMRVEIQLKDLDADIMSKVIDDIRAENQFANEDLLINAFIEGTRGLALGADDLEALKAGHSLGPYSQRLSA